MIKINATFEHEAKIAVQLAYKAFSERGYTPPTLVGFSDQRVIAVEFPSEDADVNIPLAMATLRIIEADRYAFSYQGKLNVRKEERDHNGEGIFVIAADRNSSRTRLYPLETADSTQGATLGVPKELKLFTPMASLMRHDISIDEASVEAVHGDALRLVDNKGVKHDP